MVEMETVRAHLRRVPGRKQRVRVRAHERRKRVRDDEDTQGDPVTE